MTLASGQGLLLGQEGSVRRLDVLLLLSNCGFFDFPGPGILHILGYLHVHIAPSSRFLEKGGSDYTWLEIETPPSP